MNLSRILQQLLPGRRSGLSAVSSSMAHALKAVLTADAATRRLKSLSEGCGEVLEIRLVLSASPLLSAGDLVDDQPVPAETEVVAESPMPGHPSADVIRDDAWFVIEEEIQAGDFAGRTTTGLPGSFSNLDLMVTPTTVGWSPPPDSTLEELALAGILIDQVFDTTELLDGLNGVLEQNSADSSLVGSAARENVTPELFADSGAISAAVICSRPGERRVPESTQLRLFGRSLAETEPSWRARSSPFQTVAGERDWLRLFSWRRADASASLVRTPGHNLSAARPNRAGSSTTFALNHELAFRHASSDGAEICDQFSSLQPTSHETPILAGLSESVPVLNASAAPRPVEFSPETGPAVVRRIREGSRQCSGRQAPVLIARSNEEPSDPIETDSFPRQLKYVVNPRAPPPRSSRDPDLRVVVLEASADLLRRLRYSMTPRGPSLVTVETQSPDFLSFSGPRVSSEVRLSDLVG